jgi:DNA-binding Lrp family transcriptional regulator
MSKHDNRPRTDLGRWRHDRLGKLKQSAEYTSLAAPDRRLVDRMVRAHDSMDDRGIFVSQTKLATRSGVSRRTIIRQLKRIVEAGVFVVEPRYRSAGTKGGRSTNAYRINPALLHGDQAASVTQPVTQPVTQLVTAEALTSTLKRTHVEASIEAPLSVLVNAATEIDEGASVRDLRPSSPTRLEEVNTGFAGMTLRERPLVETEWERQQDEAYWRHLDAERERAELAEAGIDLDAYEAECREKLGNLLEVAT